MKSLLLVPVNERIECATNTPLSTGLLSAQLELPMACGGNGLCATCHVHVVSGMENLSPISDKEKRTLSRLTGCKPESRLSCQCRLLGDVTVKVPEGLYLEALEGLEEYIGKRAGQDILHPGDGRVLVGRGQVITKFIINKLKEVDFKPWSGMASGESSAKKII